VNGGSISRGNGNGANGNGNGGLGLFQNDDHTRQMDLEELKLILRDELDKLPAKYRLPLVLHYFGGLKPEETARELGCKPSTLGVRLHRGRKLLAESLGSRGFAISGSMLTIALAAAVQASISEQLLHSTCHAAAGVMSGQSMAGAVSSQ